MSRPLNLYRLQQIDTKIDHTELRLEQIAAILSENENLRKATLLANKASKNLENAQKKQRQAETKVHDQRVKIEQIEATLYSGSIKNPKELQDMQNEVVALKRFLEVLEDRQLETMLEVDEAEEKNQQAQEILKKYQELARQQQSELIQERDLLEKEVQTFTQQKNSALTLVIEEDLKTYHRIRKQRAGIAVAKVKDRACNACGSTLTAALHQAARSPSQVTFCDSCGRILYAT